MGVRVRTSKAISKFGFGRIIRMGNVGEAGDSVDVVVVVVVANSGIGCGTNDDRLLLLSLAVYLQDPNCRNG
jgi:hypothetical protein